MNSRELHSQVGSATLVLLLLSTGVAAAQPAADHESTTSPDVEPAPSPPSPTREDAAAASTDADGSPYEDPEEEPIDVVVTGTRARANRFDSPADVTVIAGNRLNQPGHKSFREPLTEAAGVRANARGENPSFSGLEMRGLNTNSTSGGNVLILLDGIPQRRLSFGGPYMGALPYDAAYRMEVVKGPLSAQYGRGSLAGAVQLFTNPGTEQFAAKARAMHEFVTNTQRGSIQISGPVPKIEDTGFSLTGSGLVSTGWQPRTGAAKGDLYLHMSSHPTPFDEIHLMVGLFDASEEAVAPVLIDRDGNRLAGIDRDANLAVPNHNSLDLTEVRVGGSYARDLSEDVEVKLTAAFWDADTHWLVGRPSDQAVTGRVLTRPARDLVWHEHSFFSEAQGQSSYRLGEGVAGVVTGGVSGEYMAWESSVQSISAAGATFGEGIPLDLDTMDEPQPSGWVRGDWTTRETDEVDWGVFLSDTTTFFDWVTVHGAVRYDGYRRSQENLASGNASTVSHAIVSPMAGGVLHLIGNADSPAGLNIYGTWGRGFSPIFRAVSNTEIVELAPETSESIEAGVKTQAFRGKCVSTVARYQLARDDVVGWNPDAQTQQNVGDWLVRGAELTVRGKPLRELSIYGWGTVRDAFIERDAANPANEGNELAFVANFMAAAGAAYKPTEGPGASLQGRLIGPTFADDANTIELPAYVLLDADISYRYDVLTVSCFGRNLIDADYYSAVFLGVRRGSAFAGTPRTFGVEALVQY